MVKQQRVADMSEQSKEFARSAVKRFEKHVSSASSPSGAGILKMHDSQGSKRVLYTHQVIATQRLMLKEGKVAWANRKAALLAIHEVGTGKTVTGVLTLAAIHVTNPRRDDTKTLIICPLSVVVAWKEAVLAWTTLVGDKLLCETSSHLLTEEAIAASSVIITTADALIAAFKTFAYMSNLPEDMIKPKMQRFRHGHDPKKSEAANNSAGAGAGAGAGGSLPEVHPLFKLLTRNPPALALTIIDEIHRTMNPGTLAGHVVGMFAQASTYKLGLTGTAVTAKPRQISWLARTLDARPEWLQKAKSFFVEKGGADKSLRRASVAAFHELLVDRVDASFVDLPDRKVLLLEYDPYVGRRACGETDPAVVARHNEVLASAQSEAINTVGSDGAQVVEEFGREQRAAFGAIIALGNFEFDGTLGVHGAYAFNGDSALQKHALQNPSECVKLITRVILDRQNAGHCRIAVFSESTTQLHILQRFLNDKDVGKLYFFDGTLNATKRANIVNEFLNSEKAVLLLSAAGAIGITLCPGCEVLLSVGSLPWNASTVTQAHGRVYRIGQTMPVEIIQFAARRSVTSCKLSLHDDKRDRLAKAVEDEDFRNFATTSENWRFQKKILESCVPLRTDGNYKVTNAQEQKMRAWKRCIEVCDANGIRRPDTPRDLPSPPRLAQDVLLPEVSFKV